MQPKTLVVASDCKNVMRDGIEREASRRATDFNLKKQSGLDQAQSGRNAFGKIFQDCFFRWKNSNAAMHKPAA